MSHLSRHRDPLGVLDRRPLNRAPVIGAIGEALAAQTGVPVDTASADLRRPGHIGFTVPGGDDEVDPGNLPWCDGLERRGHTLYTRLNIDGVRDALRDHSTASFSAWAGELVPGTRVAVEHTSINPVHPVHIGALRGSFIGSAIVGLLRAAGARVCTHFFVNDLGRQVSELATASRHIDWSAVDVGDDDFADTVGAIYAAANLARRGTVEELRAHVLRHPEIRGLSRWDAHAANATPSSGPARMDAEVLKRMLRSIELSLARVGISIDAWDFESNLTGTAEALARVGRDVLPLRIVNGTTCADGRGGTVSLRRRTGQDLYFTRDVAYMLDRASSHDLAVNVIGEDQRLNQELLEHIAARCAQSPLVYVPVGWVSVPGRRFSARRGQLVSIRDLLSQRSWDEVQSLRLSLLTSPTHVRRVISDCHFEPTSWRREREAVVRLSAPDHASRPGRGSDDATIQAMLGAYPALVRSVVTLQPHHAACHARRLARVAASASEQWLRRDAAEMARTLFEWTGMAVDSSASAATLESAVTYA